MKSTEKKKTLTERQRDFIAVFPKKSWNVSRTCAACNVDRKTYYNWLKNSTFADAIHDSVEDDKDMVEDLMRQRMRGVPILDEEKKIVGWRVPPSDTMLIWWSKSKMPERGFSDKPIQNTDNTIEIKHTVQIVEGTKAFDVGEQSSEGANNDNNAQ